MTFNQSTDKKTNHLSVAQMLVSHRYSQAMFSSFQLGIFEYLDKSGGNRTAEEIAQDLMLNSGATKILLDMCVSLGLLEKSTEGPYSNAPQTKRYLLRKSQDSLAALVDLEIDMQPVITENLTSVVQEGTRRWEKPDSNDPTDALFQRIYATEESFTKSVSNMVSTLKLSTKFVATAFDLSGSYQLCDIGGSTGTLAYTICTRYPQMKITVFDLPQVVNIAPQHRPSLAECPNQGNVSFAGGDFFKDELPKADLYTICRILHGWDDKQTGTLLDKVFSQLPSGGGVLIGEIILNDDELGPKEAMSWSLVMMSVSFGRERSGKAYGELLTEHGFVDVQYKLNPDPLMLGVVFARKP